MEFDISPRFKTKKDLKNAVKAGKPVYATPLGVIYNGELKGFVAGPDPYNNRRWYAQIELDQEHRVIRVK